MSSASLASQSGTNKRTQPPMEWTEASILLCREILVTEPFKHKKGSVERGKMWNRVAESLNSCQELHFKVTQRAVREKFVALQGKFKSDNQKDEMSSGTSKDVTELELLIEEITEKEQAAEENRGGEDSMKKIEADRA
ncbi:hypothetical protein ABVT39_011495 [Epinephelus coioides]